MEPDLIIVCSAAAAAVFWLLAILAGAMRLLTLAFPVRATAPDAAVVALISTAVAAWLPGARVTQIEEVR